MQTLSLPPLDTTTLDLSIFEDKKYSFFVVDLHTFVNLSQLNNFVLYPYETFLKADACINDKNIYCLKGSNYKRRFMFKGTKEQELKFIANEIVFN